MDEILDGFSAARFGGHEDDDLLVLIGLTVAEVQRHVAIGQLV